MLTFIIPVRHPLGVADWAMVKRHLAETLASLHNQTSDALRDPCGRQPGH